MRWISTQHICEIVNLYIKHIPNNTFRLLIPTIRSIHIQMVSVKTKTKLNSAMPGKSV